MRMVCLFQNNYFRNSSSDLNVTQALHDDVINFNLERQHSDELPHVFSRRIAWSEFSDDTGPFAVFSHRKAHSVLSFYCCRNWPLYFRRLNARLQINQYGFIFSSPRMRRLVTAMRLQILSLHYGNVTKHLHVSDIASIIQFKTVYRTFDFYITDEVFSRG